jgi:hypothetical protein
MRSPSAIARTKADQSGAVGQLKLTVENSTVTPKLKTVCTNSIAVIDDDVGWLYSSRFHEDAGLHQMKLDERVHRARFTAAAKVRTVVELETAIATTGRTISALSEFIATEERRTKVTNRSSAIYSMAAKDSADRSDRLQRTIAALKNKLHAAISERDSAVAHVSILEATLAEKASPSRAENFPVPTTGLSIRHPIRPRTKHNSWPLSC